MRIGITGGIGSGKSRVAEYWARWFGLPLIDLDQICRNLLVQGQPGWQALVDLLDGSFFYRDGSLDRTRLRTALFASPRLRQQVDKLLHPLARSCMHQQAALARSRLVLIEIPLLFEAGWQDDVDRIVLVFADDAVRVQRVARRDSVQEHEAVQAIAAQAKLIDKVSGADHVLDNSGVWPDTCLQIHHLGQQYARTSLQRAKEAII